MHMTNGKHHRMGAGASQSHATLEKNPQLPGLLWCTNSPGVIFPYCRKRRLLKEVHCVREHWRGAQLLHQVSVMEGGHGGAEMPQHVLSALEECARGQAFPGGCERCRLHGCCRRLQG
eukprot:1159890-Pelagomonas_calceolata.AAC.1